MIQILQTNLQEKNNLIFIENDTLYENDFYNCKKNTKHKKRLLFKIQLYLSSVLVLILTSYFIYYKNTLNSNEKYSSHILSNYGITRLYAESTDIYNSEELLTNTTNSNNVLGIIEISNINVYYPIFSNCSDELLKTSPCRFYGPSIGKTGNLCIAGHNYDNDKFFSNIKFLKKGDKINLYNNSGKLFLYTVTSVYEVKNNDLSPIYNYDASLKQLTLVTCNNFNKNRIIVKAINN